MRKTEPDLRLSEFFVEGGDQKKSHVLLHITEPSTPEEKAKGYFFAICETSNAGNDAILSIQDAIDKMENEYYENNDNNAASVFEKILEKINEQNNLELTEQSNLHCVAGIIRPPEIILTFHNQPQILLFYRKKDGEYQKIDIVKSNPDENNDNNPLFSQIIQGKIGPRDYLLAASPHLADYFSPDRLQKIISTRTPEDSAGHLEKVMTELRNGLSFGGLIVHYALPDTPIVSGRHTQTGGKAEVNKLFITEQKTAQTLDPSFTNSMGQKIQAWQKSVSPDPLAELGKKRSQILKQKNGAEEWLVILRLAAGYLAKFTLWMAALLLSIAKILIRMAKTLFFLITNWKNKRREIINDYTGLWRNYKQIYEQLPKITKWLLLISALVLSIILIGIMTLRAQKQSAAEKNAFMSGIKQINEAVDAAEGSLVYGNNLAALEQISIAEAIYRQLPCAAKKFKSECQNVKEKMLSAATRTKKITTVEPQLITNLATAPDANIKNNGIIRIGNKILTFGQGKPIIYDLMTKSVSTVNTGFDNTNFISGSAPKENDYAVLLTDNNQIFIFNPNDNTLKRGEANFPTGAKITAIVVYNRRLYSLDATNSQIYKHDSIKNGFGPAKSWLKTNADLADSADITVEGDIFVLTNKGNIYKFSRGEPQTFPVSGLNPPLIGGNKIWSYNDLQNLYVLDASGKRLLIIDKTGQLQGQITSEQFTEPTGMTVDEINKSAYILDSGNLYQIPLP